MTMRNKLIEAAARAIYEDDDPWSVAWPWPDLNPEAQGGAAQVERYRQIATAAVDIVLGLMMEPSEEMVEAGWEASPADAPTIDEPEIKAIFQAMLGAIK